MIELSPFPVGCVGVDLYHSGAWHDVTADFDQGGVTAAHGVRSEGGTADVASMQLTLSNSDGTYTPRNPDSALYGLIGRNTPVRSTLAIGAPWLDLDDTANACAYAPDSVALSITGDIDVRWYGVIDDMSSYDYDLINKWGTAGQRSYALQIVNGDLAFYWSADGTAILGGVSAVHVPEFAGRIALRATLTAATGAYAFYWADSLTGTWHDLGDPVAVGATSIKDSTAHTRIGKNSNTAASSAPQRILGWQILSGITTVSSCDTADLTIGATPVRDDQGTEWTLVAGASVTNRHIIAQGVVSEWPMTWTRRGAPSVMTSITGSGPTRRMGQGATPVDSVLRKGTIGLADAPVAYWPCEDSGGSVTLASALTGAKPMTITGTPDLGSGTTFECSAPIPQVGDSAWRGAVPAHAYTGVLAVTFIVAFPSSGMANGDTVASVSLAGPVARADLVWGTTGTLGLVFRDSDGTVVHTGAAAGFGAVSKDWRVRIALAQDGVNVDWALSAIDENGSAGGYSGSFGGTLGRATSVRINPSRNCAADLAIGHVCVFDYDPSAYQLSDEVGAWAGEAASGRIARLCADAGVDVAIRGRQGISTAMGQQSVDTLPSLLDEAAASDGGILHDDVGLRYRSRRSMYAAVPLAITYTDNLVGLEPVDDDATTRNRVTVTRIDGSSATETLATGPLSVADVGLYDEDVSLSLYRDSYCAGQAAWRVHLGTWDEARYPSIGIDLAHPTFLADPVATRDLLMVTVGDRLTITDPPAWLPPDDIDVIITGRQTEITPMHVRLDLACVPARPWQVLRWDSGARWCHETTLAEALDADETDVDVTGVTGVTWTHDDGDFDLMIGGERVTVTAVAGNTLTVTRGVNGVVKTHASGAAVACADRQYWGR